MPFPEKTAWVMGSLLTLLGVFYFNAVWKTAQILEAVPPPNLGLIILVTVMLIIGAVIANIFVAIAAPEDSDAPSDERDKLVACRAGNISGWILGIGVFVGLWHYLAQGDGDLFFHIIVASLILSQIAEYVLQIVLYCRGV